MEIDESYFSAKRLRESVGVEQVETPVLVMLKRDDCVYTQIVKHLFCRGAFDTAFKQYK